MPIKINSKEIAKIINGDFINDSVDVDGISIDSRTIKAGNLFIAISGDRFDGNDFIKKAYDNGAAVCIGTVPLKTKKPYILVKDAYQALVDLAIYHRNNSKFKVIAITGSAGKTTVKEMLKIILQKNYKTFATAGNLNNEYGVPLSILSADGNENYAILEMGANHLLEIKKLSKIAKPDIVAITNILPAHLDGFGSTQNIAVAKSEIVYGLKKDGSIILNSDSMHYDILLEQIKNKKIITCGTNNNDNFKIIKNGFVHKNIDYKLSLQIPASHNFINATIAIAIAQELGQDLKSCLQNIAKFNTVAGRLEQKITKNKMVIIDDSYNANPESIKSAIDYLMTQKQQQKWFLMGHMAELGEHSAVLHQEIGLYAKEKKVDKIFVVGQYAAIIRESFGENCYMDNVVADINKNSGADVVLLVKGSRSAKMEQYVESLLC